MADPAPQPSSQPAWLALESRILTMLVALAIGYQAKNCEPEPVRPIQPAPQPIVVATPAPVTAPAPTQPASPSPAPVPVPVPTPAAKGEPQPASKAVTSGVDDLVAMAKERGPQIIDQFEAATKAMIADARAKVAKK
jgi:hypothetical protein